MTDRERKQLRILVVLLVLVAIVFVYRLDPFGGLGGGPQATGATLDLPEELQRMLELPDVPLDKIAAERSYDQARNLFVYAPSPQELEAQRRAQQDRERRRQAELARAKAPPPPPPRPVTERKPAEPAPPSFEYTFIGRIGPLRVPDEQVAFLLPRGKAAKPRPVKVGEVIDDTFVLKSVDLDELTVGFTDPRFADRTQKVKMQKRAARR